MEEEFIKKAVSLCYSDRVELLKFLINSFDDVVVVAKFSETESINSEAIEPIGKTKLKLLLIFAPDNYEFRRN